jgi:hypothetical protein
MIVVVVVVVVVDNTHVNTVKKYSVHVLEHGYIPNNVDWR